MGLAAGEKVPSPGLGLFLIVRLGEEMSGPAPLGRFTYQIHKPPLMFGALRASYPAGRKKST